MRVLHVLHQYFPDHVGGVEYYVRGLAQCQVQAGHQVSLFCRRSAPGRRLERETVDGMVVYRAANGPFTPAGRFRSVLYDPFLARSLAQAVAEAQPDVVHIHHLMGLPVSALLQLMEHGGKVMADSNRHPAKASTPARRSRGISVRPGGEALAGGNADRLESLSHGTRLVVTLHDYWWVCANSLLVTDDSGQLCEGPRAWLNCARCGLARAGHGRQWPLAPAAAVPFAWRAALLQRLAHRVSAWIAPTEFVAGLHLAHGWPAARLNVLSHGVDVPAGLVPSHHEELGTSFRVAYVGGLARQKGVHVLIEAFNGLPASAHLTVAGDESAFPQYCADLHRLAVHPGIRFEGRLERAGVWRLLAKADVLVMPSLSYETSSLAVQEAYGAGTPVIATDHGALAERVRDGVNGLLVPAEDVEALRSALRRLMEEPGLLARLRSGIGPVTTVEENARQVEVIYQRALLQTLSLGNRSGLW